MSSPSPPGPGSSQPSPACPLSPARLRSRISEGLPGLCIPDMALLSPLPPWPYPLLCPLAPRKGSWLADKVKRLMRPRREGGLHGGPRPWADGAGSTESLGGPPEMELSEGREADGTGGSGGQVTRMVPTPCPLPSPRHLPTPPVSSSFCCLRSCLGRPCLLHLPQMVPVALCSASPPHPSYLAPSSRLHCHLSTHPVLPTHRGA